jgi:hypothetical protein
VSDNTDRQVLQPSHRRTQPDHVPDQCCPISPPEVAHTLPQSTQPRRQRCNNSSCSASQPINGATSSGVGGCRSVLRTLMRCARSTGLSNTHPTVAPEPKLTATPHGREPAFQTTVGRAQRTTLDLEPNTTKQHVEPCRVDACSAGIDDWMCRHFRSRLFGDADDTAEGCRSLGALLRHGERVMSCSGVPTIRQLYSV